MPLMRIVKNIFSNVFILILINIFSLYYKKNNTRPDEFDGMIIPAYTGLGNFILKTPMIKTLHEKFPKTRIIILAGSSYGTEHVLGGDNVINEVKILKENSSILKKIKFAFKLRKEKIDVIFLPFDASPPFVKLISIIANIPIRIGHSFQELKEKDRWTKFVTNPVQIKKGRHEIDLNLDLLGPLGITNVENKDTFFSIPKSIDTKQILAFDPLSTKYWCVQLGAANAIMSVKRWDSNKFAKVLDNLINKYKIPVVALGDKYEREIFEKVQNKMKNKLVDCVGKTTIKEAAFIIKNCKVLLCHDSGLMHIAVALKTPVVAIYGPTDFTRTAPLGPNNFIIKKEFDCSPCMFAFGRTEREVAKKCQERKCMNSIDVKDVIEVVSKVLGRK